MRDGGYDARLPLSVRAGLAWESPGSVAIALDVAYYLGTGRFTAYSGRLLDRTLTNDRTTTTLQPESDYRVELERQAVVDANAGLEVWLGPHLALRGGVFTDFTSTPPLPDEASRTLADVGAYRVDRFGGTLGLAFRGEATELQLGLMYLGGLGQVVGWEITNGSGPPGDRLPTLDYALNSVMVVFSGEVDALSFGGSPGR